VDEDFYSFGKPLTREGLFQLVTDEAFRDGQVSPTENKLLVALTKYLRIPTESARSIANRSRQKFKDEQLGLNRPFDKERLYKRVLRFAISDGRYDENEYNMIEVLRSLFKVSLDDHEKMLSHAQMELGDTETIQVVRDLSPGNPFLISSDKGQKK